MQNTTELLETLKAAQSAGSTTYKPVFFRLSDKEHRKAFDDILRTPGIIVSDRIEDHIAELIKYKTPWRKFSTKELQEQTKKILTECPSLEYGLWVWYPWSNRLVHIPDQEDFINLRTSRNQYKITREERELLAQKKIGVIGLSVGQSVSVTLAMERICGELRLADFDVLELTNLNRIRTGIHNLGIQKVYSVAREIAEIDPFINVVCFPQGLSEDNMDEFFTAGGRLDLLIEESDGFDIKIMSRYKARSLQIPVLMEGSDRCAVDVERFDLEPDRVILHGLVNHLDVNKLKTLKTNEEKIPYMLDMLGLETSSQRLKASMLEIEQSINTWPQLASAVTMGGGITADVARRLLLNQYTESGRYHVDIEELIGNKKTNQAPLKTNQPEVIDFRAIAESLRVTVQPGQANLSEAEAAELVEAGCLAPSGGNVQPWRWVWHHQTLILFNAFDLSHTMLGYDNLSSYVALGAAIENVRLRASEKQLKAVAELFPVKTLPGLVATISFFKTEPVAADLRLAKAVGTRLTNRLLGDRVAIAPDLQEKLQSAAKSVPGVSLRFFTSAEQLDEIADVLGELERIRLLDETGHRDFVEEVRWTAEESESTRDGVDLRTLDLTATEKVGMEVARDPQIMKLINIWKGGGAFKKLTKKSIDAAGAVGILTMRRTNREDYLAGGIALERVWLEATLAGVAFQPMSASVFVWARLLQGKGKGLGASALNLLPSLRPRFENCFGLSEGETEIFIFRLSAAGEPKVRSLRKHSQEIFCYF